MNWGDLTEYPFLASVWGDAATWVGALMTGAAALIAAFVYAVGRRAEKWAQALLIYFEPGAGGKYEVHNRSDKPIVDVRVIPVRRSLWSAARVGNYTEAVIFGPPPMFELSSYDLYQSAKKAHSKKAPKPPFQSKMFAEKIEPDHQGHVDAAWIQINGFKSFIEFRDVHGRDWRYDVEEEKLKPIKRRPTPLKMESNRRQAAWWIVRNQTIYIWRNYMDHRKGKPSKKTE